MLLRPLFIGCPFVLTQKNEKVKAVADGLEIPIKYIKIERDHWNEHHLFLGSENSNFQNSGGIFDVKPKRSKSRLPLILRNVRFRRDFSFFFSAKKDKKENG